MDKESNLNNSQIMLSDILLERGPLNCSFDSMKDIVTKLHGRRRISEKEIAHVLGMMARTFSHFESRYADRNWDVEGFVKIILGLNQENGLDWPFIFTSLDYEGFFINDVAGADVLVRAFRASGREFKHFPIYSFLGARWENIRGQISFIRYSLLLPSDVFNYSWFHSRKVIPLEEVHMAVGATKNTLSLLYSQTWNCLELMDFISRLVDTDYFDEIRPIFELASRQSPEILCIALSILNPPWNSILKEILVKLTCGFIVGQSTSSIVLPRIWQHNPNVFFSSLVETHRRDPTTASRILDIAQDLKLLASVLDAKPFSFSIDIAALASRREHLNLEKWLQDSIREKKDIFVRACLDYLAEKIAKREKTVSLSNDVLKIFITTLLSNSSYMSAENNEYLRELQVTISSEMKGTVEKDEGAFFSPDIEEDSKRFFEKIYTRDFSAKEILGIFVKLKDSSSPRDQQVFNCMVHNLIEEYQSFAKYPDRELGITAIIFGGLIQNQLISFERLGVALRCVLESLKKPVGSKLFKFGLATLLHFQSRLFEWPQYCVLLLQIPTLSQVCPDLLTSLRAFLARSSERPVSDAKSSIPFVVDKELKPDGSKTESSLNSINFNTLLEASNVGELVIPAESIQDRIFFIVNNLSLGNVEGKSSELMSVLKEPYFMWFSRYLVIKRASIEPNYHLLYVALLTAISNEMLESEILSETYQNIKILLDSSKILGSSSERSLLKNLGIWLGSITVARSRPILHKHINLKGLLIDGYENGRLIAVIPFVCKVLEQANRSKIFCPLNPWLMSLISLLVELYLNAELKLNLKFEIEVLCKNLNLELKDIVPSSLLKSRSKREEKVPMTFPSRPADPLPSVVEEKLNSLPSMIVFNPQLPNVVSSPLIRKIIVLAIEFAVREVASTAIERSVMIAGITTKELVCKDFYSEVNEEKYKRAALQMMQNLTGSLAMVTAKEPMRTAIVGNISLFLQIANLQTVLNDQIIQTIADDNIEVACAFVEKSALVKAQMDVDEFITKAMSVKRKNKEVEVPSLVAPNLLLSSTASLNQSKVYDDFIRMSRLHHLTSIPASLIKPVTAEEYEQLASNLKHLSMDPNEPASADQMALQQSIDRFLQLMASLEKILVQFSTLSFSSFASNHELRTVMKQIILLALNANRRDEVCLLLCQKIVQCLYKIDSNLGIEVCIILLMKICEISPKAAKEVVAWIIYAEDERKFNAAVTCALLTSGLIGIIEYDAQLSKYIEARKEKSVDFAVQLIQLCILGSVPIATVYDFISTVESLTKFVNASGAAMASNPSVENVTNLHKEISSRIQFTTDLKDSKDPVIFFFNDWIRLTQYPSTTEKLCSSFVSQLFQQGTLKNPDSLGMFFRIGLELCVDFFIKYKRIPSSLCYQSADGLAKLVVAMCRHQFQNEQRNFVSEIWSKFLSTVGSFILEYITKQNYFFQKPISRLLFSLLEELDVHYQDLAPLSTSMILGVHNFLCACKPSIVPSFVFAWIELVSNPFFFPKLLNMENRKGWSLLISHMTAILEFLYPFLKKNDLNDAVCILYRGLLRVLLVLLHDFPDFLAAFHLDLTNHIPPNCVQLRNLVLSAFPKFMKLPDPFTPNLKVDLLPEIMQQPLLLSNIAAILSEHHLKDKLDEFLRIRAPKSFLLELKQMILKSDFILNATVLYVGISAVEEAKRDSIGYSVSKGIHMEIFQFIANDLSNENRYKFLNAICNQLRYPNSHTHYFSCVLLQLFSESSNEFVKEQITRVLLERLIVNRPHPWGLLITFIELIKNAQYGFWNYEFTRYSPEIERLFDSVAKSCMVSQRN